MSSTGNSVGGVATYTCDPGFELDGSTTTECIQVDMNSVAFSPDPPVCKREYCVITIGERHALSIVSAVLE